MGLQNNGTYLELTEGWVACEQVKLWRLKKEKKRKRKEGKYKRREWRVGTETEKGRGKLAF